jgi:hypothetical protein
LQHNNTTGNNVSDPNSSIVVEIPKHEKDKLISAFVDFASKDIRPFSIVEGCGFAKVASVLIEIGHKYGPIKPEYVLPSATTISRNVDTKCVEEKNKMKSELLPFINSLCPPISLTTDLWTEPHKSTGWIGVTLHYIDDKWKMNARNIECIEFENV